MEQRLIDANALMETIRAHDYPLRSHFNSTDNGMFTIGIQQAVDEQPTVDAVEVVHGRWLEEGNSCSYIFHCSVCGGVAYFVHGKGRGRNMERRFCGYRYCPNCGAKMDGKEKTDADS